MRRSFLLAGLVVAAGVASASALFTARVARRVESEVPACGRFIEVRGNRLHIIEAGEGAPVVFVHGLGGQLQHFTYSLFGRLAARFHLIAFDRPGAGYSARREDAAAQLAEQARLINDVIVTQQIHKPLLVGHSLGAAVALRAALDYPESIAGLALLAPLTRRQDIPWSFQMLSIPSAPLRWLFAWTLATPWGVLAGRQILDWIFSPEQPPEDFNTRGAGLLRLRPSSFYATALDLVSVNNDLPDMEPRYAELKMPVGVLHGTADNVLDPRDSVDILAAQLPKLEIEYLDGAGHMLPICQPDVTAAFIQRMTERAYAASLERAASSENFTDLSGSV